MGLTRGWRSRRVKPLRNFTGQLVHRNVHQAAVLRRAIVSDPLDVPIVADEHERVCRFAAGRRPLQYTVSLRHGSFCRSTICCRQGAHPSAMLKYNRTFCSAKSANDTSAPVAEGNVKSGATSPSANEVWSVLWQLVMSKARLTMSTGATSLRRTHRRMVITAFFSSMRIYSRLAGPRT